MIFYSDEIINNIIDHSEINNIINEIEIFEKTSQELLHKILINDIHYKYIDGLFRDKNNKIAFYCFDFDFFIHNCPSIMVYQKINDHKSQEIKYYILLMCTRFKFRGMGYATKLLDGFIEKIRKERTKCVKPIKIILSSVEDSVLFYESYGFKWTCDSITDHNILMEFEKYEDGKEYFILELLV
jgi:predicted GNAT family N-acyltransferase